MPYKNKRNAANYRIGDGIVKICDRVFWPRTKIETYEVGGQCRRDNLGQDPKKPGGKYVILGPDPSEIMLAPKID